MSKSVAQLQSGLSLLEMMVVMVIVLILLAVAQPTYRAHVIAANRTQGIALLNEIALRQEHFFFDNRQYASALSQLGMPADSVAMNQMGQVVAASSSERIYSFSLSTTDGGYAISAVPQRTQVADEACATLSMNQRGERYVSGTAAVYECW